MRLPDYIIAQFTVVNNNLHEIASDLTPDELVTRALPNTNLIGFDLWHIARAQDWAAQTMARGVPEVLEDPRWQSLGSPSRVGIGVGMTEAEADSLAHTVAQQDSRLCRCCSPGDCRVAGDTERRRHGHAARLPTHIKRHPPYLSDAMREEVPWMYQQPPMWRCLNPGLVTRANTSPRLNCSRLQLRARA